MRWRPELAFDIIEFTELRHRIILTIINNFITLESMSLKNDLIRINFLNQKIRDYTGTETFAKEPKQEKSLWGQT